VAVKCCGLADQAASAEVLVGCLWLLVEAEVPFLHWCLLCLLKQVSFQMNVICSAKLHLD
jgi:hypothetical protein